MSRKRTTPLRDERVEPGHCSSEQRAHILSGVPYFQGLSAPGLDAVNHHFRAIRAFDYPAGATIYHESEPAEALFLVAHGRVKLLQHSILGEEVVLDTVARDLEAAHTTIREISTLPVEARVALVLLRLADRFGEADDGDGGILIQSPLSQQDLAAMVGSTAETVSRVGLLPLFCISLLVCGATCSASCNQPRLSSTLILSKQLDRR